MKLFSKSVHRFDELLVFISGVVLTEALMLKNDQSEAVEVIIETIFKKRVSLCLLDLIYIRGGVD